MPKEFNVGDFAIVGNAIRYQGDALCFRGWPPDCTFGKSFSYAPGSLGKVVSINHPHWTTMSKGKLNLLLVLFHLATPRNGYRESVDSSLFSPKELFMVDPENLEQELSRIKPLIYELRGRGLDQLIQIYQRGLKQIQDKTAKDVRGVVLMRADMPTRWEYAVAKKTVDDHYAHTRKIEEWMHRSMREGGYVGSELVSLIA